MTTATASNEISTETNSAAQEDVKINMPALPDAFGESQLLELYTKAEKEAKSVVPDVTTQEGRKNIKDMARKVAASNKAVDTPMRDYLRILKAQPKVLEKNARESKARFDTLKADILKPLEDAQAEQDAWLEEFNWVPTLCSTPEATPTRLNEVIEQLENFDMSIAWPELKKKFKVAHESALTTATVTLERITQQEEQAARLAELEAQAEEQRQKDRDREVAEAAAKQAQIDAEAKAQKDREDVDRRAAEAKQREEAAKAAEAKAIRDAEIAEQRRIDDAAAAEERRKQDAINAEARQAEAVKRAQDAEVKRQQEEEAAQAQAAKDREADKAHRIKINRAALVDLIAAGVDEEVAKTVIRAIGRKEVRNISIQY